ncbi:MAG: hypothetical protein EON48_07310 [Acetobacteraceae bacterium]|nr:MAG: hypothetical protein EON48_07310 [Acetobacteraceae bacterium]
MRIFEGIDYDRSNSISYTEFLAASLSRRLWLSRERMRDAFQRLDVDGKGFITKDNLKELLGDDWTAERVEIMMREADSKSDGRIGACTPKCRCDTRSAHTRARAPPHPAPGLQTLKSSWLS